MKTKKRQRRGRLDGLRERKEEERKRSGRGERENTALLCPGISFLPYSWQLPAAADLGL